jgi:hypothetical protein
MFSGHVSSTYPNWTAFQSSDALVILNCFDLRYCLLISPIGYPRTPGYSRSYIVRQGKETKMAPKRAVNAPSAPSPSTSAFSSSASTTLSSGPKTLSANSSVPDIAVHVWQQYLTTTPQRTLLLDAFMAFLVLVGGVQFAYCVLAGNYVCLTKIISSFPSFQYWRLLEEVE